MVAALSVIKKIWPYLLIATLGLAIFFGFRYYSNKVEDLTRQNTILETQNAEINNNYNTLKNLYNISLKQAEELAKQQKEAQGYVAELRQALNSMDLKKAYEEDADKLLKTINDYEKCYAINTIKNPSMKCYKDKQ